MKCFLVLAFMCTGVISGYSYYKEDAQHSEQVNRQMAGYVEDFQVAKTAYEEVCTAIDSVIKKYDVYLSYPEWIEVNDNRFYSYWLRGNNDQ